MKLRRVKIENFRSIKSISLDFDPSCRVLVGINESGKSNIIRALALLEPARPIGTDDVRDYPAGEALEQEAQVLFMFALDEGELDQLHGKLGKKLLTDKPGMHLLEIDGKGVSLRQLCALRAEILYEVNLVDKSRRWTYWIWKKESTVPEHVMKPKKGAEQIEVQLGEQPPAKLGSFRCIDARAVGEEVREHLEPIDPKSLVHWISATYS